MIALGCALGSLGTTTALGAERATPPPGPRTPSTIAAPAAAPPLAPPRPKGPGPIHVTLEPEIPRFDLAARVPAHWLSGSSDRRKLTPARWRRRMPPECKTRGGFKRHCSGALIMPEPDGRAAVLAERMGLGLTATAMQLLYFHAFDEWRALVRHADPDTSLTFPVPDGNPGRGFGHTRTGDLRDRSHDGLDIGAPEGAEILAARGGLVAYAGKGITGYGNIVILLHRGGDTTMYAHCRALRVFAGQYVERGAPIAEVGTTGFAPIPHLHFEHRVRGHLRDPAAALRPRHADAS